MWPHLNALAFRDSPRDVRLEIAENRNTVVAGHRLDGRLDGAELTGFRERDDPDRSAGVLVESVREDSAAWRAGLREGDVIVAANRFPTRDVAELAQSFRFAKKSRRGESIR